MKESQIFNLKFHFGLRASVAGRRGGLLKEARPRQNCLGLARALAGGFAVAFGNPHFPSLSTVLSLRGSGAEPPPREYRDLVRRYFLKLSEENPLPESR